jgi:AcrR family transcriptional regulator
MAYPSVVTREAIVAKAVELVEKRGDLTLQQLARALGIRAPSLYRYFNSRERLLAAVGLAGFAKLAEYIRNSTRHDHSLERAAWAIRRFAKGHPSLYRLMNETDPRHEDPAEATAVTLDALMSSLGQSVDTQALEEMRIPLRAVRAFIHGYVMLELSGQFQNARELDESFTVGLEALLNLVKLEKRAVRRGGSMV